MANDFLKLPEGGLKPGAKIPAPKTGGIDPSLLSGLFKNQGGGAMIERASVFNAGGVQFSPIQQSQYGRGG